jgi:hypothetical protein
MNDNRLRNFGLGFAIFGFGLNLGVKIATGAPINWQPNIPTAVFLLVLSCASIIVGLSIIAVSLVPGNIRSVSMDFVRAQRQFVALWLIGILIVGFLGWQSISLYRLQRQQRLAGIYPVSNNSDSVTVPLPRKVTEPYSLTVTPNWNTTVIIQAKTSDHFSVEFNTTAMGGNSHIEWQLVPLNDSD